MESLFYTQAMQRGVSLLLPGLLAAEAVGSDTVETPYLCRLLSRSKTLRSPRLGLESIVYRWFNGADDSDANCAALLGYRHEKPGNELPVCLMRADPVYQQMDVSNALLADQSVLRLNATEADSLVNALNVHFSGDGVSFEMADPLRWYCRLDDKFNINTCSMSQAVGRDVALVRPAGDSAQRWRSMLAEIEMLLFDHPVNLRRVEAGEVPVNSLWMWGEGQPCVNETPPATVFSDNFYVSSLASFLAQEVSGLDNFAAGAQSRLRQSTLVVEDNLARAATTADESLRSATLLQLEQQVFEPLWSNLRRSGWHNASIWTGGQDWLYLDPGMRRRFWQRSRPLQHFISARSQLDEELPGEADHVLPDEVSGR